MEVISRQKCAQKEVDTWRKSLAGGWVPPEHQGFADKIQALASLPDPVDLEVYERIWGSEILLLCCVCRERVKKAIEIENTEDKDVADSHGVICEVCLEAALVKLRRKPGNETLP